jgi:hypothetical protein
MNGGMYGGPQGPQQQQQINVNPADMEDFTCQCGCMYYQVKIRFKKMSAVHPANQTGRDIMAPLQVVVCEGCGKEPIPTA